MFLSGALDDNPKKDYAPPPPMPKSEGPAWGGAKIGKGSSSLREIQDEQSKTKGIDALKAKKLGSSGQRNATRCGLWWVEMLKTRDQFKEAATVYFRISGEVTAQDKAQKYK
ncbi:hypothetical protein LOK49_LG01G02474 [Camellia lanceoleosa]|uniref:Uncharacterized protein n=1 Tax=Camellia lanceoleosa TaxID=1840588 RepID=A0ACC0IZE9_9ERIC|nr:hypothetical protein LOK49_LG01G02474 [Camellia lanceoleosa]